MAPSNSATEDERFQPALIYAKQMLWTCLKCHDTCKSRHIKSNKFPTRVIDVGDSGGSREPFLFIPGTPNISAQEPKDSQTLLAIDRRNKETLTWNPSAPAIVEMGETPYVALSYCWGKTKNFTTTSANLASMKERIPWNKLPQTIRDAIITTRALGIQYLWVDALCIIQDLKEDWEAESTKMMDVYGGAFLTIAAALGPDVHYGLVRDSNILTTATKREFHLQDDPLYSRAWALQERMLSTRLLIFSSKCFYWECDTSQTHDQYGEKVPPVLCRRLLPRPSIQDWHWIVRDYTCRNMTNERDKLPALSGLATVYGQTTQKDYLAGLWRQSLMHDLLWSQKHFIYGNKVKPGIPSQYRAPSWSWASLDGNIWYTTERGLSPSTKVLGTYADDPDGKMSNDEGGEWLSLSGPLLGASITMGKIDFVLGGSAVGWIDQRELNQTSTKSMPTDSGDLWSETYNLSNVWCLLLGTRQDGGAGLVLTKVEGFSDRTYRRIGYFNVAQGTSFEICKKSSIIIV